MGNDDFNVILAELKKDIAYIKLAIDDKFKLYDHKVEEFNALSDRVLKLEIKTMELDREAEKRKDTITKIWIGLVSTIIVTVVNIVFRKFQ